MWLGSKLTVLAAFWFESDGVIVEVPMWSSESLNSSPSGSRSFWLDPADWVSSPILKCSELVLSFYLKSSFLSADDCVEIFPTEVLLALGVVADFKVYCFFK